MFAQSITYKELASVLGINWKVLSRKVNLWRGAKLTNTEREKISEILGISTNDIE